ncbi:type I secretion system permease/ATPase [Campylobacter showae]|uniref:peptidase domain-containing ABC transporter n=1 Tax=Campylobacter showae TaxID=204 RepID=UPI002F92EAA0
MDSRAIIRDYALNSTPSFEELIRIAKDKGFKAKIKPLTVKNLTSYPLPCIARDKNGVYFNILKVDASKNEVLIFKDKNEPYAIKFEELLNILNPNPKMIVLKHKLLNDRIKFGFGWFYARMLSYKKIVGEILIASFVIQLFGLVTPLFTQVVLDKVLVHHSLSTLNVIALAFVAVIIFEMLLGLSRNYIFAHTTSKIDARLGAMLFDHLIKLPMIYFENRKVGNIVARVRELDSIREFIANKSVTVLLDMLFSVVFVIMMLLYSVKLTSVALAFVTIIATLYFFATPRLRARLEDKFQMGARSNSYLVESITGISTVKSLAIEGSMQRLWEDFLAKYVKSSFELSNLSNILSGIANALSKLMTLSILYLGVGLVIENKLSVGQLIAFQMFAGQFSAPIMRLVGLWNEFQQALLSVDRLGDILNTPKEQENDNAITLNEIKGGVKFDNVSFKYSPNSPIVLQNFSLEVKPNTSIGIVGRSGSGKSTLTRLLQRLYYANEGAIYIDGVDIRHMNPSWLRQNIGVVLQDSYLFSGSVKENIAYAYPSASMDLILQASRVSGADEFISALPEGYDTLVGEQGSSLSGGQKQRIAIARAILTNPRILIFDEATSALDYESEKIISNNLAAIKKNRTVFIVAHRLSTVKDCNEIIVLDKGRLIEKGDHESLMKQRGYYYFLNSQQETGNTNQA